MGGIRSRDREIAPTEEGRVRSGDRSYRRAVRKSRDREIAPTEERSGVSGRDGKFGSGGVV